ncbi:hypothetical protein Ocin01_13518, partial [Orchesella cincta]
MKCLEEDGVIVNGTLYLVNVSCVVADAPARAFVKGIKPHTAYHACERCQDDGNWNGRMCFSRTPGVLRSDQSFRIKVDSDHHVVDSPLLQLRLGMVTNVVLDYMHLICLGVMRKLLHLWLSGPLKTRLSGREVKIISLELVSLRNKVPDEFCRRPRTLKDVNRFKATELRQFLLYTGPCVLKTILPSTQFKHFLKFSL